MEKFENNNDLQKNIAQPDSEFQKPETHLSPNSEMHKLQNQAEISNQGSTQDGSSSQNIIESGSNQQQQIQKNEIQQQLHQQIEEDISNSPSKIENANKFSKEKKEFLDPESPTKLLGSATKSQAVVEESDEEDVKTLSQLYIDAEREEKLHNQLSKNELTKKCRYTDGYIYQQVYSCITCYMEQIKNLPGAEEVDAEKIMKQGFCAFPELMKELKPHGICLGCMLHCHENHDVVELYAKLDFRCDCGNGRMPFSCSLYENKEDYENDQNRYNQNFFDIYCYCKQPHQTELIDQFMIQCFECEDWYHNHHLNPKLSDQPDEKFILICKNCQIQKYGIKLLQYKDFFHETSQDQIQHKNNETPSKRQKLSNAAEKVVQFQGRFNCKENAPQVNPDFQPFDIIIDDAFIESSCQCDECKPIFDRLQRHLKAVDNLNEEDLKLQKNLEGELNEDEEETKDQSSNRAEAIQSNLTSEDYLANMMKKVMQGSNQPMSHQGQIFFAEEYNKFKEYFVNFLKQFENKTGKITTADIQKFLEGLENLKSQRQNQNKFQ
eukprot:403335922